MTEDDFGGEEACMSDIWLFCYKKTGSVTVKPDTAAHVCLKLHGTCGVGAVVREARGKTEPAQFLHVLVCLSAQRSFTWL